MEPPELGDKAGQQRIINAVRRPDGDAAAFDAANLGGRFGELSGGAHQLAQNGQQQLAFARQADAGMVAVQQREAGLFFQRSDDAAHARRRVVKFFGGGGQRTAFDGAQQHGAFFRVHGVSFAMRKNQGLLRFRR